MGCVITIIGGITAYRLWGDHTFWSTFAGIATLYQASSLNEIQKEAEGLQEEDKGQAVINFITTSIIIALFIYSFF